MIQTIENQKDEIFDSREGPHSTIEKSSNENTPNMPNQSPPSNGLISTPPISFKNNSNQIISAAKDNKTINNKSDDKSTKLNTINSSQNSNKDSINTKDFIEKKRKRRNKCSYSNNRNKRSKKRLNTQQINQLRDKITPNKDMNIQKMKNNRSEDCSKDETQAKESDKTSQINVKAQKEANESTQKSKRKAKNEEKELIVNAEKLFMENINKEYSDEQYLKDLDLNLKEERAQFMKENFPIMYRKDKYYLYTILLKKRRTQTINFILPNNLSESIKESKNIQTLYEDEEPEKIDHYLSDNSVYNKNIKAKNKDISISQITPINYKSQIKDNQKLSMDTEIISSLCKKNKGSTKLKKEVEHIKKNLTETKKTTQDKNKKCGIVLSETSPSEHDAKNSDMNQDNDFIEGQNKGNNYGIKFKKTYNLLPKHVWSYPKDNSELNIEAFYDDCIQVWPFNECIFVKEIALEFLMQNNYDTSLCLNHIKDFVFFMKKRAVELDFSLINKNEKTVKKYCLRNTKNN